MGSSHYAQEFYKKVGAQRERELAVQAELDPNALNETCEWCGGLVPRWMTLFQHVTIHCRFVTDDEVQRVLEEAARKASEQAESG